MSGAAESAPADGGLMRVSSDKISRLMDLVGELSLSVSETVQSPDLAGLQLTNFDAAVHRLNMIVREVQDAATELRLVPIDDVFRRLRRMVRELERQTGKQIEMEIEGGDTAIDKLLVTASMTRSCMSSATLPTTASKAPRNALPTASPRRAASSCPPRRWARKSASLSPTMAAACRATRS